MDVGAVAGAGGVGTDAVVKGAGGGSVDVGAVAGAGRVGIDAVVEGSGRGGVDVGSVSGVCWVGTDAIVEGAGGEGVDVDAVGGGGVMTPNVLASTRGSMARTGDTILSLLGDQSLSNGMAMSFPKYNILRNSFVSSTRTAAIIHAHL